MGRHWKGSLGVASPPRFFLSFPHRWGGPKLHLASCRHAESHGRPVDEPCQWIKWEGRVVRVETCKVCYPLGGNPRPIQSVLDFDSTPPRLVPIEQA